MSERTYVEPIPRAIYPGASRLATPALDVDDDVTHLTLSLLRLAWASTGSDVIRAVVECEAAGQWRKCGALAARGGIHTHHFGFIVPASTGTFKLPRATGRRVRVTLDLAASIEVKCDISLTVRANRGFIGPLHNSVAFLALDGVTGISVSSLTTAAFAVTGADRAVLAFIGNAAAAGGAVPSGVTWDVGAPEALSSLVTLATTYGRASWWGRLDPTSATDTITVTWAASQDEAIVIGHSFTDVDVFGNTQSGTGTAAEPSETLTGVGSDDMCLDGVFIDTAAAATEGADQTLRGDENLGGAYPQHAVTSTQPGTAGGAVTWTVTGSPLWIHVAVALTGVAVAVDTSTQRSRGLTSQQIDAAEAEEGFPNELDVRNWFRESVLA